MSTKKRSQLKKVLCEFMLCFLIGIATSLMASNITQQILISLLILLMLFSISFFQKSKKEHDLEI